MYMNMQKPKGLLATGKRLRKRVVQDSGKLEVKTDKAEIENVANNKRLGMIVDEGPPGVFGEQGNTGNLAIGTREQSRKIVGNKGTSNRLGNRGTNTKNYKTLRFLHKRGGDRRFSGVYLSLALALKSIFTDMCRPLTV